MHLLRGLQLMVGFSELIHGCIQFDFSREVSFSDNAQVIGTYPGSSKDELFGICASRSKTYCLTMYYHMYGGTINTLTIRTQKGNNAAIDRWTLSGNQGDFWHHLSGVNLPLDSQTKIIIEATKGSSYTGDIAIDYVELWPFACP
uniref:MAM domain-containing glycosylphosphatidylinositol anchor protein 1 n=1 Tax=Magallana gigas TaxID=29159 RepID=K1PSY1_MAGGI